MGVAALALALTAAAQAEPAACSAATAAPVSVETLAVGSRRWIGRCVRLSGPVLYSSMYSGLEGFYLTHRRAAPEEARRYLRHRVGVEADDLWPEELERW